MGELRMCRNQVYVVSSVMRVLMGFCMGEWALGMMSLRHHRARRLFATRAGELS